MNRTAITIAIISAFFAAVEALAIAGRCYHRLQSIKYARKDRQLGVLEWAFDDYIIFVAHVLALINYILWIYAGFEGLGTEDVKENNDLVQNLFLAIEVLLIESNFLAKASFGLLLTRIATIQQRVAKLSRLQAALISGLGVVAALVVIIPCWPQARGAQCLHSPYRWIFLAVIDVLTEVVVIVLPLLVLRDIQFRSAGQRWKLALVITIGRCSVIPLAITSCVAMLRSSGDPYLGPQLLDPMYRQQGELFASLFTSTLVPVFNLFQITKIEVFETSVELNITKTVELHIEENQKGKGGANSSAASISTDTRELLDQSDTTSMRKESR